MSCKGDPKYVVNLTCYIKAVRGKQGLINLKYNFTGMPNSETWCRTILKYRNSAGVLLPYLVNVEFNICTIKDDLKSPAPSFLAIVVRFCSTIAKIPLATENCPIHRGANINNLNFEDIKKEFLPPTIPEGTFIMYWIVYFPRTNQTILEVKQNILVRSTGVTQLTMLNMG